jgi:hypothetical protein
VLLRRLTYGTPAAESPLIHVPSARLPVPADQPAPSPRRWFARR